jgi:hypothetical protein
MRKSIAGNGADATAPATPGIVISNLRGEAIGDAVNAFRWSIATALCAGRFATGQNNRCRPMSPRTRVCHCKPLIGLNRRGLLNRAASQPRLLLPPPAFANAAIAASRMAAQPCVGVRWS